MLSRCLIQIAVFFATSILFAPSAFAACIDPPGVEGFMIYNDDYNTMQFCDGSDWISMGGAAMDARIGTMDADKWCAVSSDGQSIECTQDAPAATAGSNKQVIFNDGGALAGASNLVWDKTFNSNAGGLAVGSSSNPTQPLDVTGIAAANAVLVKSTSGAQQPLGYVASGAGGTVIPMTMAERQAISSPTEGMTIYNSTTKRLEFYNGTQWVTMGNGQTVIACVDPNGQYITLQLPLDGTNGSTSFPDKSSANRTATAYGNAQIATAQSKFGGASAAFDGSADGIFFADSPDLELGSGDFTIEFWFRPANVSGGVRQIFGKYDYGIYAPVWFGQNGSIVQFSASSNGGSYDIVNLTTIATGLSAGTWYHLALARNGNTWRSYLNGSLTATITASGSIHDGSSSWRFGTAITDYHFNGHIDDFRMTKGVARYTGASFTVPTEANTVCY